MVGRGSGFLYLGLVHQFEYRNRQLFFRHERT